MRTPVHLKIQKYDCSNRSFKVNTKLRPTETFLCICCQSPSIVTKIWFHVALTTKGYLF